MGSHEILFLVFSYFAGSIPTGFIVFRISAKNDIRNEGSGNIGATNIFRILGGKAAAITLLVDVIKGILPVIYGVIHFKYPPLVLGGGALAIIGHCYPIWLKFRGGKGVATFAGVFIAYMAAPDGLFVFPVFALIFIFFLFQTGYVSISSIAGISGAFFTILFTNIPEASIIILITIIIIVIKHRRNIERLRSGTENKLYRRENG